MDYLHNSLVMINILYNIYTFFLNNMNIIIKYKKLLLKFP